MDENHHQHHTHTHTSTSHISPLLLVGHLVSSSSTNTAPVATVGCSSVYAYAARGTHPRQRSPLPFSSYALQGVQMPYVVCSGGEDASAAESLPLGFNDLASSLLNQDKTFEADLDGYDTDSEDGVDLTEESPKPVTAHRPSGSKRSRAAEVHNLSEKRRRSRINEKMKALQKLIPNSNKTDKASMLDEAIDYLKQLQLQVQMLSMRNGLNMHPMYIPSTLQHVQASQMHSEITGDNATQINGGMGMLPIGQEMSSRDSFDLPSQCTLLHQPLVTNISHVNGQVARFEMEAQRSQHGSFHLALAEGRYTDDMMARQQLNSNNSAGPRLP